MLKSKKLSVNYGNKVVLNSIDLSVNQGEVYAILGCNGAGKTTLFRTIMDLKMLTMEQ